MQCPSCKSENSDSAKFCKKCGTPLKKTLNHGNMINTMNHESKRDSTRIIIVVLIIIAIILAGAFAYLAISNNSQASDNTNANNQTPRETSTQLSSDSQASNTPASSSIKILSGSFSTGSELEDKTYAKIYVGSQNAGKSFIVQIFYSRDGNSLNNGNMVPATVDSDGYLSISSADSYKYYPDYATIKLYDSNEKLLDTLGVSLSPESGTQTF